MTQAHTPGPWTMAYHAPGNDIQGGLAGYSIHNHEGIAYNICREANARLIAEAPAMLDALREVTAAIDAYADDWNSDRPTDPTVLLPQLRAILDRIDG